MTTNEQVQAAARQKIHDLAWKTFIKFDGSNWESFHAAIDAVLEASRATPAALDPATVERCASEAEWEGYGETGRVIAKRIRALAGKEQS
jgi:hypothetical protein